MREPQQDPLGAAAESLKWQLAAAALTFLALYLLRETILDARAELEQARRSRAHLEVELEKKEAEMDGALEALHKATNGGD